MEVPAQNIAVGATLLLFALDAFKTKTMIGTQTLLLSVNYILLHANFLSNTVNAEV